MGLLAAKVLAASTAFDEDQDGFQLERPRLTSFTDAGAFEEALRDQREHTVLLDAKPVLGRIDLLGRVQGTDYRLSASAFGDLCHQTQVPSQFIRRLAGVDPDQAIDVLATMTKAAQLRDRKLVIDRRTGRVDGIVGGDSYALVHSDSVLKFAKSASPDQTFGSGWIEGPFARWNLLSPRPADVGRGDLVHTGTTYENSINGDHSVRVTAYWSRLVCTNGMLRPAGDYSRQVLHRGSSDDVSHEVQKAALSLVGRHDVLLANMRQSDVGLLPPEGIRAVRQFIRSHGSARLDEAATTDAQQEAAQAGRAREEVTLWNFVNGVTAQQHSAPSLQRRRAIETLGLDLLTNFVVRSPSKN